MSELIVVTGASGTVGGRVAQLLLEQRVPVRALVRDVGRADSLRTAGAEVVQADLADDDLARHFTDAAGAFLMVPLAPDMESLGVALNAAAESAQLQRVVRLSAFSPFLTTDGLLGTSHRRIDEDFSARGFAGSILRPESFMQNLFGMAATIQLGQIYNATGEGRSAFIDAQDIAASAVALLTGAHPCEGVHDLTGPAALSWSDVAAEFSAQLGREVTFVDIPVDAYREGLAGFGLPGFMVDALSDLVTFTRGGGGGFTTDSVQRLTGSAPRSLAGWVRDNLPAFRVAS